MSFRSISKELQEVAISELNEVPERIPQDLKHMKEWLAKQPHIKPRNDDQFLLSFLRASKYSLERAKTKLDMFYTLKSVTPEIFTNRDPFLPELQIILAAGIMLPLPKLAHPKAPRHVLIRISKSEPDRMKMVNIFKMQTMILDILLEEDDNYVICGIMGVQDLDKMHMGHITNMSPALTKKVMTCYQQGYPIRIKGLQLFNAPSIFELMNRAISPFLSEKFKSRMSVLSNMEEVCKVVPKSILPEDYGGEGGKLEEITAAWKSKVESYSGWFKEQEQYTTDEKKRPGKPKTVESVFGIDGSFRKLSVD